MAKQFDPVLISQFGQGLITKLEPNKLPMGAALELKNVVFDSDGAIGPRGGFTIFGNNTAAAGRVRTTKTYTRRDGVEVPTRVRDNSTNTIWEWYSSVSGNWETLYATFTTGYRAAIWEFNTSSADRCFFTNGVDNLREWNGAITNLNGALVGAEATITVDSTTGFAASGSIIIGGTTVTYSGKNATQFTGAAGTPAAADNAGVTQLTAATSLTGTSNPVGRIVVTGMARAWVSGYDTTGSSMIVSKINDPVNYAYATPRIPGEGGLEDFVEGGGPLTSLYFKDGSVVVFKRHSIILYKLQQENVSTDEFPVRKVLIQGPDVGSISHSATIGAYNDVFFVSKKGGIRRLSRVGNAQLEVFDAIDLSDPIRPTIKDYDFSDASATFYDQKYMLACKSTSAQGANDRVLVYDYRTNGWSIWHMSVNDWFIYGGELYFGSSAAQNTYKMFDGYEDSAGISIGAEWRSGFIDIEPGHLKSQYLLYVEGSIATGTTLTFYINYDDGGRTTQVTKTITGSTSNAYVLAGSAPTFGSFSFGTTAFGGGLFTGATDLNRFRVYFTLPKSVRFRNFDVAFGSNQTGGRWKVSYIGFMNIPIKEPPKNLKV